MHLSVSLSSAGCVNGMQSALAPIAGAPSSATTSLRTYTTQGARLGLVCYSMLTVDNKRDEQKCLPEPKCSYTCSHTKTSHVIWNIANQRERCVWDNYIVKPTTFYALSFSIFKRKQWEIGGLRILKQLVTSMYSALVWIGLCSVLRPRHYTV